MRIDSQFDTFNATRLVAALGQSAELLFYSHSHSESKRHSKRDSKSESESESDVVLSEAMQMVDRAMTIASQAPEGVTTTSGQVPRVVCEQRAFVAKARVLGLSGDKRAEAQNCVRALGHGAILDQVSERARASQSEPERVFV